VLPVRWGAVDGQTPTTLRALAEDTAAYWAEQTDGAITIPTITVREWRSIAPPTTCDYAAIAEAARIEHGLDPPTNRDHTLVYFPKTTMCGWAGLAYIGGGQIWINGYGHADAWEHEFGHNLGLQHANATSCVAGGVTRPFGGTCTAQAYADYDVMGYARSAEGLTLNAALADVLGIVDDAVVGTAGTTVTLSPISARAGERAGPRALKIPVSGGTMYVEYRPSTGRDATQPARHGGVQVRHRADDATASTVLAMAPAGTGGTLAAGVTAGAAAPNDVWAIPGTQLGLVVEEVTPAGARVRLYGTGGDTTPPPAPAVPTATATATATGVTGPVTVGWSAVTDSLSGPAAAYRVLVDGVVKARAAAGATSAALTGLTAGVHQIQVAAVNAAGLAGTSGSRSIRYGSTAAQPTAPVITSPLAGAAVATSTVRLTWAPSVDAGVLDRYEVLRDGEVAASVAKSATAATVALGAGPHTFAVRAVDWVNRTATSAARTVTGDAVLPTVTATAPTGVRRGVVTITAGAADNVGVAKVQLLVGGAVVATDTAAPYALAWNPVGRSGAVAVTVRAYDRAGNAASVVRTVTVDNVGPTVTWGAAPAHKAKVRGIVRVNAGATDAYGVHRVQVLVNGAVVATDTTAGYSFALDTRRYARTMTVTLRAYDRVGNARVSAARTWYR
jgi:hypothetical protein